MQVNEAGSNNKTANIKMLPAVQWCIGYSGYPACDNTHIRNLIKTRLGIYHPTSGEHEVEALSPGGRRQQRQRNQRHFPERP
jgi:hypothetical protein